MKRITTLLAIMVLAVAAAMAQAPEKFTYQAVVRNASNSLVANAPVGVRVSILQGGVNGTLVYMETQTGVTNANGLITLQIGGGNVQQGAFADIDWANGTYFLKTETDPDGGSNYSISTTQQLLSVPYALYAKEAGNIPTVPANVSAFTNDAGYLTTAQCGDIDICDLAELVAQLQQQVATLQQQIDSLQGQSGQDTTTNPIDTTTILLPTVFTSTASNITSTSAMVGGNVTSDGGASVIARGVCWSTSQNPTVSNSHTTDGGGMGSFTSNITGLAANTTYYVRAYATNSAGTAYGEEVTFTTLSAGGTAVIDEKSCPEAQTVTDHEGNVYATVQIGNQCWMRDNLRTTTSPSTGTYLIPAANANYTCTGKQARWYNNDSATYAPMNYGLLYNWNAAADTFNTAYGETSVNTSDSNAVSVTFTGHRRGICPAGWHLPSDAEWTQLTNYVSSQSVYQCGGYSSYIAKALASTEGWWNTSTNNCAVGNTPASNNATGFSAVPAGTHFGSSSSFGIFAIFWSSTEYSSSYAYNRYLAYENAIVASDNYGYYKSNGYSVRCLRDQSGNTAQVPTVTTSLVSEVATTSATCGGNITDDGGSAVIARGVCWSTSHSPTTSGNHTDDGEGMGSFTSNLTGLTAGTTYFVRAYATNGNGTKYGEEVSFSTPVPFVCGTNTVSDYEGHIYNTVQIGDQCWMKENMRATKYFDGTSITQASVTQQSSSTRYYYDPGQAANYGYLYNWPAAKGPSSVSANNQGICPTGWHVPSDGEWTQLEQYVSSQSNYRCSNNSTYIAKALASTTGWASYTNQCAVGNTPASNNATGFSAVPAGYHDGSGFNDSGSSADFWSSTEYSSSYAYTRYLNYVSAYVGSYNDYKSFGYSVRCLRD